MSDARGEREEGESSSKEKEEEDESQAITAFGREDRWIERTDRRAFSVGGVEVTAEEEARDGREARGEGRVAEEEDEQEEEEEEAEVD